MDNAASRKEPIPIVSLLPSLTKQYRHGVLQLCQGSNTRESWTTTQYLLEKCWTEMPNSQNSDNPRTVHLCPQCGAWLHPGWQGSTLRVARFPARSATHRTRQRRIQRKKRRALLLQSKKAKEFNTNKHTRTGPQALVSPVEQVLLRNDSDLFLDRHHLVIRCGRCDAKIRIKGLKREVPPTKQSIQQAQVGKGGTSVQRHDGRPLSMTPPASSIQVPNSLGDGDFLELPPGPSKATTLTNPSAALSKTPPLHLRNPKKDKKKAKVGGGKDSKLLNFLSSLND